MQNYGTNDWQVQFRISCLVWLFQDLLQELGSPAKVDRDADGFTVGNYETRARLRVDVSRIADSEKIKVSAYTVGNGILCQHGSMVFKNGTQYSMVEPWIKSVLWQYLSEESLTPM